MEIEKKVTVGLIVAIPTTFAYTYLRNRIDDLAPREMETLSYRPRRSLAHIPLALAALISAAFAVRRSAPPAVTSPPPVPSAAVAQDGHLLVVNQGTGQRLSIVDVGAKADPCGPNRVAGALHGYSLAAIDAAGTELGNVALDLSAFDLQVGAQRPAGPRVTGDQVFESDIALLAKLPKFDAAVRLEIRQHGETHSVFGADAYRASIAKENK